MKSYLQRDEHYMFGVFSSGVSYVNLSGSEIDPNIGNELTGIKIVS